MEFPVPKGHSSVLFRRRNTATGVEQLEQSRALLGRQAKVMEAREVAAGPLSEQLLTAVAENERLNRQLHGLHNSTAALRQAIADARTLQMHLQQEAADAREPHLPPPIAAHRPLYASDAGIYGGGQSRQLRYPLRQILQRWIE